MAADDSIGNADSIQFIKVAQAVDLDQVEVVRLEKLEAGFHGSQSAVAVPRVYLGGEKDVFPALLGKFPSRSRSTAPVAGACRNPRYRNS